MNKNTNNEAPFFGVFNKPTMTVDELKSFLDRVIAHGQGYIPVWTKGDDGYSKIKHIEVEYTKKGFILVLGQNLQNYP